MTQFIRRNAPLISFLAGGVCMWITLREVVVGLAITVAVCFILGWITEDD